MEENNNHRMKIGAMVKEQLENRIKNFGEFQKLYITFEDGLDGNDLRRFCNELVEQNKVQIVCGLNFNKGVYNYIIIGKNIDLKSFSKPLNEALNGRGGGNGTMLQGSFNADKETIEKVLIEKLG